MVAVHGTMAGGVTEEKTLLDHINDMRRAIRSSSNCAAVDGEEEVDWATRFEAAVNGARACVAAASELAVRTGDVSTMRRFLARLSDASAADRQAAALKGR